MTVVQIKGRCVREWSAFSQCDLCITACPTGAVSADGRRIRIAENLCTDCGVCMRVCPTEALVVSPPYSEIAKRISVEDGAAEIECGVHVACIGHIDEALILHLKSQGAKSVTVVHCERCPKGVDVEKERRRIEKLGVSFREKPGGAALRVEHRQRPKQLELAAKYVHQPQIVKREDVWLVRGIPEKRKLLLDAVRRLGTIDPVRDMFGGKIITDACQYHETCAVLCPTGALRTDRKGAIYYRADLCVKCKTCLVSCAAGAIQPIDVEEHEVLNGVEKRLVKFNLRRCVECGAFFADRDGHTLCPACRRLKEELKEIFGPYRDVTHI